MNHRQVPGMFFWLICSGSVRIFHMSLSFFSWPAIGVLDQRMVDSKLTANPCCTYNASAEWFAKVFGEDQLQYPVMMRRICCITMYIGIETAILL